MNSFFYGIAHIFECMFRILPAVGPAVNVILIAAGSIGAGVWIWFGIKNKEDKGNYKAQE